MPRNTFRNKFPYALDILLSVWIKDPHAKWATRPKQRQVQRATKKDGTTGVSKRWQENAGLSIGAIFLQTAVKYEKHYTSNKDRLWTALRRENNREYSQDEVKLKIARNRRLTCGCRASDTRKITVHCCPRSTSFIILTSLLLSILDLLSQECQLFRSLSILIADICWLVLRVRNSLSCLLPLIYTVNPSILQENCVKMCKINLVSCAQVDDTTTYLSRTPVLSRLRAESRVGSPPPPPLVLPPSTCYT